MAELKATLILSTTNSEDNITFDNEDILSFSTRNRTTSDPNVPIYNSFATNGTLVVSDRDLNLYNKALSGVFDKYEYIIKFYQDDSLIATHIVNQQPVYDFKAKTLTLTFGSKLDKLDELTYNGYSVPRNEVTGAITIQTAKYIMDDLLLSAFGIKQGDEEYENLMTNEFSKIFSNIIIPVPYMPAKTYREAFQNVLTLAKCALTVNEKDELIFVRKDLYFHNIKNTYTVPPENVDNQLDPTIIVSNKYDDCQVGATKIGYSGEEGSIAEIEYDENEVNDVNVFVKAETQDIPPAHEGTRYIGYDCYIRTSDITNADEISNNFGYIEESEGQYIWGQMDSENTLTGGIVQTLPYDFYGMLFGKVGWDKNAGIKKTAVNGQHLKVQRTVYNLPNIELGYFAHQNLSTINLISSLTPSDIKIVFEKQTATANGTLTLYKGLSQAGAGNEHSNFNLYSNRISFTEDGGTDSFTEDSTTYDEPEEVSWDILTKEEFELNTSIKEFIQTDFEPTDNNYITDYLGANQVKSIFYYNIPDKDYPRTEDWTITKDENSKKFTLSGGKAVLGYTCEIYTVSGVYNGDISEAGAISSAGDGSDVNTFWYHIAPVDSSGDRKNLSCKKTTITYRPKYIYLTVNGTATKITLTNEPTTLVSQKKIDTSKNTTAISSYGELLQFQGSNKNNIVEEIDKIVDYYSTGLHTAKITVLGGVDYFDNNGEKITRPFLSNDILDVKDYNGVDSVMYYPATEIPLAWSVVSNELNFDGGVITQSLELQELPWIYSQGLEFGNVEITGTAAKIYSVIRYTGTETVVKVPEKNEKNLVEGIYADAFATNKKIKTITMPNSIVSLIAKTDSLPNKPTIITGCFEGCTALESISLSSSIGSISVKCFYGCSSLKGITISNSVGSISANAFTNCTSIKTLEIPNSVEQIGENVLSGCTALESLSVPFIGSNPTDSTNGYFGYLFGASSYELQNSSIPSSLKTVNITNGTTIPQNAFNNCDNIENIIIGNSVEIIDANAFYGCGSLINISFGKNVTEIGLYAFKECISIKTLSIPDSVINIFNNAFEGCTALTSVNIGNGVDSIAPNSFMNCTSIKRVEIKGNSNTYIGEESFYISDDKISSALEEVVIKNADYIGQKAFANNKNLKKVELSNSPEIATKVFSNCSSLSEIRYNGTYEEWRNLQKDTGWNEGTPNFSVICQDVNIILDKEDYAHIVNGNEVAKGGIKINSGIEPTELYIPTISTINTIAEGGYENTYGVTAIHIGSNIKTIEASAFQGCEDVTTVYLPASVTMIGDYAFAIITSNLVTIEYQGSEDKWNAINKTVNWNGNWALVTVTFKEEM